MPISPMYIEMNSVISYPIDPARSLFSKKCPKKNENQIIIKTPQIHLLISFLEFAPTKYESPVINNNIENIKEAIPNILYIKKWLSMAPNFFAIFTESISLSKKFSRSDWSILQVLK
tara:strand:- start:4932 stop:5282 length:351 start_codon:yes stop_codon:yes gene_type:complete